MVEPDTVEAVLQRQYTLDFMRLYHRGQNIPHDKRRIALGAVLPAQIIGDGQDAAQIVRGVAPFGSQPGVVEVQPTDHCSYVESGGHGLEFV